MRAPYLRQIAQPLAAAAPPLRSSRRWPLRADETRLPATAPPAPPARPTSISAAAQPPASQAAREVFDPPASSATALRTPEGSMETAPVAPQTVQSASAPMPAPNPLPAVSIQPPGPQQIEPPRTVAADVRLADTDPGVVTTPELGTLRPGVAVSSAMPEASRESRPEIVRSETSDGRSARLPPAASAVEPPGAPAPRTLRTEAISSAGLSSRATVSGPRGPDRDRGQDDPVRTAALPSRRSFTEPIGKSAPAPEPSLRIGTIEVRVAAPPVAAAPPQGRAANPSGTLSRGFVSPFGLRQG